MVEDRAGKRISKWMATGLSVKGNKKKAEAMLQEARQNFVIPSEEVAEDNQEEVNAQETEKTGENDVLFADFMVEWLEMMKFQVEITTHAAYSFAVNTRIIPYFREKGIFLKELQPKHLHDFYQYVLKEFGLTTTRPVSYEGKQIIVEKDRAKNEPGLV